MSMRLLFEGMDRLVNEALDIVDEFDFTDDDIEEMLKDIEQQYDSSDTSINSGKLPAVFNHKGVQFNPKTINLDYGGGKFDNATEYLLTKDVVNLIYDPFNRKPEHNKEVLNIIKDNGGADTATLSNVLNVIQEEENRVQALERIKKMLKPNGTLYITIYEGNGSGEGSVSQKGKSYQLNKKTKAYLEEIQSVFPNAYVKYGMIFATR